MQMWCSESNNMLNTLLSMHSVFYCKHKLLIYLHLMLFECPKYIIQLQKPPCLAEDLEVDRDINIYQLDCQMNIQ